MLTALRERNKSRYSGRIDCFLPGLVEDDVACFYFLAGLPIHFSSPLFGDGFAGLLAFYVHQRHVRDYQYENVNDLCIVERPTLHYSFDRLVLNLFDSYQEKMISQKLLVSSYEYFLE